MKKGLLEEDYLSNPVVAELLEAINDGFWDWNIETGEVFFSRRWIEMLGFKQGDIKPHVSSWELIVHPEDLNHVMKVLDAHLRGETDHYETEHRVRCKNGEWKWIIDRGRVIQRTVEGKPLRAVGSHIDISDRILREQEKQLFLEQEEKTKQHLLELNSKLEEAVRKRDEFLSIASHELKTPLTSLLLLIQSLGRILKVTDPQNLVQQFSKKISQTEDQLLRLRGLVDDMLDVTRIESDRLYLNKESFDLAVLVQDVADRLNFQITSATGEELRITHLDRVEGNWDRYRIEQALTNLITNAIRYGKGKPIELGLKNTGSSAIISVRDHGNGIPKDFHQKIFDLFERGFSTREMGGLGLGLYISKKIVDFHQGKIWVESEEGKGATFYVELPS